MRDTASTFFILLSLACGYLFATGATYAPWQWAEPAFLERVLAPFQVFSFFSGVLILAAVLSFLFALLCFECVDRSPVAAFRRSWGQALEITFLVNVVLVGGLLFLLWFLADPSFGSSTAPRTMGALFAASILEVTLGTVLAVLLFFFKKTKVLYFSTLVTHVTEVVVLGLVFALGTNV